MNKKSIDQYCIDHSTDESDLLKLVDRQTQLKTILSDMSSGHLQGRLLSLISKLINPRQILELGTFTGYATLSLAEGLAKNGILHTIEKRKELEFLIHDHISASPYLNQIKVYYGPALDIIRKIDGSFQLIFIDAAKIEYTAYYDALFDKWESGGVMIVDNVIWYGHILDPHKDSTTQKIHEFNQKIKNDSRVENFILPFRDGLNVIRKK